MVKVKLWSGKELELDANDLRELLLCLRNCFKLERYVRDDGRPSGLLLVFVDGVESRALESWELEEGSVVELYPVLHRG